MLHGCFFVFFTLLAVFYVVGCRSWAGVPGWDRGSLISGKTFYWNLKKLWINKKMDHCASNGKIIRASPRLSGVPIYINHLKISWKPRQTLLTETYSVAKDSNFKTWKCCTDGWRQECRTYIFKCHLNSFLVVLKRIHTTSTDKEDKVISKDRTNKVSLGHKILN